MTQKIREFLNWNLEKGVGVFATHMSGCKGSDLIRLGSNEWKRHEKDAADQIGRCRWILALLTVDLIG